jgi:hypothetical protein
MSVCKKERKSKNPYQKNKKKNQKTKQKNKNKNNTPLIKSIRSLTKTIDNNNKIITGLTACFFNRRKLITNGNSQKKSGRR